MAPSESDDQREATQCARYLKALGDPVRLQIIRALQSCSMSVSDIASVLDLELPNVSHHLRVLFNAELVTTERDGKLVYYSLRHDVMKSKSMPSGLFDFGCCKLDLRASK
ncbi:MAG: ArsR/SmtB family transcription factor [Planctomycetota bacterium]